MLAAVRHKLEPNVVKSALDAIKRNTDVAQLVQDMLDHYQVPPVISSPGRVSCLALISNSEDGELL